MSSRFVALLAFAACLSRGRAAPENRESCRGPHVLADTANGRLQGIVTDPAGGAPIAGIEVTASTPGLSAGAVTDAEGRWRLADLPEGHYSIVVHRGTRTLYSTILRLCPEDVLTLRTPIPRATQ